ncbi:frizzled-3-like [Solea senegalensis]|uniref:Frizzled-3-like n=1 Tax=Solea senegalensis TaxID=28829 RepID=A0AAV6PCL3_SOLSE|nr:frizzled-3-like [Solea senegalensis]
MLDIMTGAPAGRGRTKDWFSRTTPVECRRRVPACFLFFLVSVVLLLLSLVTPALSIHMESMESHNEFSCEPIRLRMCQDLPYNTTFMPNLLNHYDQQTAALAMEQNNLHQVSDCDVDDMQILCSKAFDVWSPNCASFSLTFTSDASCTENRAPVSSHRINV